MAGASVTLQALWVAACPHEADRFFDFMRNTAASQINETGDLQIMFGVGGEHDLSERTLGHLEGWRDSSPVRWSAPSVAAAKFSRMESVGNRDSVRRSRGT